METAIACNLKAIDPPNRARYKDLVTRVRAAAREWSEIANGYAALLSDDGITTGEVAEWIDLERLCCPFLTVQFAEPGEPNSRLLTVTGPPAAKPLIEAEFLTGS